MHLPLFYTSIKKVESSELQVADYMNNVLLRYQYVLGERSWIEYWPTGAECQTEEHRATCLGMEEMAQQFEFFGCLQK